MEEYEIGNLLIRLVPRWFENDFEVYKARDYGEEMYFVEKGTVLLER